MGVPHHTPQPLSPISVLVGEIKKFTTK